MRVRNTKKKKVVAKLLKKAIRSFLKNEMDTAFQYVDQLESLDLDHKSRLCLKKVLLLFMVGELYGLPTLHSIMDSIGIKSNNYQIIWSKYSCQQIVNLVGYVFLQVLEERLIGLGTKSESTWSRANPTLVCDGSIFKQWLEEEPFGKYYAKYFSGQTHKVEYGFNLILIGMSIGDEFFPMFFHILCKGKKEKVHQIACKLLRKCYLYLEKIANQNKLTYGKIHASFDSGFRHSCVIKQCESYDWICIIAANKAHIFSIKRWKGKLRDYIKTEYARQEAQHQAKYEAKGEVAPPFVLRVKAYYQAMDIEVTLVFFRINHSKKVSVVFTTDLIAKKKTIRRCFFHRVKIEQFFRFVKHTLKIQKSTSKNYIGFLKKVALFFFKALFCQLFTRKIRRSNKVFKNLGFERIRRLITYNLGNEPLIELATSGSTCLDFSF